MELARRVAVAALCATAHAACGGAGAGAGDAAGSPADAGSTDGGCVGVSGPGRHRLFVQGHGAAANPDGSYPFLHDHRLCDDSVFVNDTNGDGVWQPGEEPLPLGPPELVHGEHFLVGVGALAEFRVTLCEDIGGDVALYLPNYDETGSRALHQLLVAQGGSEQLVAEAVDDEPGFSGYNPFVRVIAGDDPDARAGDTLVLRSTNLSGVAFSVMVWQPPSEYESWILVEVP